MRFAAAFGLLIASTSPVCAADFGEPLPDPLLAIALADALGDPDIDDSAQAYTGTIKQVCQNKGCWMILVDGDHSARVQTHHRYALPKDASGKHAIVWGSLDEVELGAQEAAHYAKESGAAAPARTTTEYRIDALGVRIEPEATP